MSTLVETIRDLERVDSNIERYPRFGPLEFAPRTFDYGRVYRLIARAPSNVGPMLRMEHSDAAILEHHTPTGEDSVRTGGHDCGRGLCKNTVYLPYLGCEDVLGRLALWWVTLGSVSNIRMETSVYIQSVDEAVAQVQAENLAVRLVSTQHQLIEWQGTVMVSGDDRYVL